MEVGGILVEGLVASGVVGMVDDMGVVLVVVVMVGAGGVELVEDKEVMVEAADGVEEVWGRRDELTLNLVT